MDVEQQAPSVARKRGFLAIAAVVLAGGAAYAGYDYLFTGASEWTDDAYVAGDVVAITPREAGTVIAIHADNTEAVKRGAPLVELDPATADVAVAGAAAHLAQSVRSVRSGFAQADAADAEITHARAELAKARDDLARRKSAVRDGAVSGEEAAHAADNLRIAQAALELAVSRHTQALASVAGTTVSNNPDVQAAQAALRHAVITRSHMQLIAPVDGIIAQRGVQLGQQVAPGALLMAVVPLDRVWIDANYRETQLADIRAGQPATVETDVYGDKVTYHGHVLGLGAGSGNAFALLPPQNASGNWIKIVQRLPVRIGLDPAELRRHPLQIGLSVKVTVDTHDHAGPPVARMAATIPGSQQSEDGAVQADRLIARILADNRGEPVMDTAPLTGPRLGIAALALALGTFMQVLDTTIANVSLTTIAGNLGVSADNSTWVITAFAVANGVTVPLTGWFMGRFGVVRTFVVSVLLFTAASLLCGVAWSLPSLILFRLLQGAVSGPMIPGSQALLISIFPESKRATALGIWSMTTLVGPVAGPILGGYISDNYHWGWIFLINVPVGLVAGLVSWALLRRRETATHRLPIDVVGLLLLAFWVGTLQMVLDLGKNADWFNSSFILVTALLSALGFVCWLMWELTEARPAVDLRLLGDRNFALGTAAFCLGYALFFGNTLLLPLWLQMQLGYTATWAGLVSAPSGLVAVLCTPLIAPLSARVDARWLGTLAFAAFALSYFMRAGYTTYADYWHFTLPLLVQGVAMSTFFLAMLTISLGGIPPERTPSATGISNFARITGGSFAASIVTTIWDRREALHQTRLAEASSPFQGPFPGAVTHLAGQGLSEHQAQGAIARQLVGQAYLLSATDIFWACGWISLGLIAFVWLARRPPAPTGPIAAD